MKLFRIAAVAALTAYGGIAGGASAVNAAPATGLLGGASAVRILATPAPEALVEKTYYYRRYYRHPYYRHYYRRHYWHPYRHYYYRHRYWRPYYHRYYYPYWHPYYW